MLPGPEIRLFDQMTRELNYGKTIVITFEERHGLDRSKASSLIHPGRSTYI